MGALSHPDGRRRRPRFQPGPRGFYARFEVGPGNFVTEAMQNRYKHNFTQEKFSTPEDVKILIINNTGLT